MNFSWLRELFHLHKWKIIGSRDLHYQAKGRIVEIGDRIILQCEKCGRVQFKDII